VPCVQEFTGGRLGAGDQRTSKDGGSAVLEEVRIEEPARRVRLDPFDREIALVEHLRERALARVLA
jgi:hypothetical protein